MRQRLSAALAPHVESLRKTWAHLNADPRACSLSVVDERSNLRRLRRSEVLREAANRVLHSSAGLKTFEDSNPEHGRPISEPLSIRPLKAIELGLLFDWIYHDESKKPEWWAASDGPQWSDSSVTLQARWEETAGLDDAALDPNADAARAVADVCTVARGHGSLRSLLVDEGPTTVAAATCTLVGAFVAGRFSPVAFAATSRSGDAFSIEAIGTRRSWRRRGIGAEIAQHFISRAREAGQQDYSIDSVPAARAFWQSQGLVPCMRHLGHMRLIPDLHIVNYELSRMTMKL